MPQLITQLLVEEPIIILIGNNTVFKDLFFKKLQNQNFKAVFLDIEDKNYIKKYQVDFKNVYKIIWLHEQNINKTKEYLNVLNFLKEITIPITVVMNVIIGIKKTNNNLFLEWEEKFKKQTQFIIDCNYYLPKANFIFGQDIIVSSIENTSLEFAVKDINKGIIINPNINLTFIEINDFVEEIQKYLFRPGKQNSILIKGKIIKNNSIINLLKKLYDSYHNINIEIINYSIKTASSIPFSTREIIINLNLKKIATKIVKNLPFPKEFKQENKININKPIYIREKIDEMTKASASTLTSVSAMTPASTSLSISEVMSTSTLLKSKKNKEEKNKESRKLNVNDKILKIFHTSRTDNKVNRIKQIAKNTQKNSKKMKRKRILFIGGMGVTGITVGIIILFLIFIVSQSILKKELIARVLNGIETQNTLFTKENNFKKVTNFVDLQINSYSPLIENDFIAQAFSIVDISKNIQALPQILIEADEASKNLALHIITSNDGETDKLAQIMSDKAQIAYEKLSYIQASLKQIDFNLNSDKKNIAIKSYENKIKEIKSEIAIQRQLQPILSSLTGKISKKTYAIILQNNQELRPTGGFIQAIALLNFEDGGLISYKVYSVYDLDKRIHGEIIPPDDIKKYLGEEKWYLRDSNWNPDFPTTSKQIAWFLNKSLGINVDGVVAINLFTLKDVLNAIGPVDLPEYNEILTKKNILERMEFHSEVVLTESAKSIDYPVIIFEKIIKNIVSIDREKTNILLSSFKKSFNDKQLLFSVFNESNQSVLNNLGWTGGLLKPQCPTKLSIVDCKVDYFAQVEANIGVNKANYYLQRNIVHEISITRQEIKHDRKIVFKNNAKSNSWPKGAYKSYQRFYLDNNSIIDKVLINNQPLGEDQIFQKQINDFKEIGIEVSVPIKTQVIVEIKYHIPYSFDNKFSYAFFNQKQSGTRGNSLKVVFKYADNIKPILIAPTAQVIDNQIIFNTEDNSLFGVEFE